MSRFVVAFVVIFSMLTFEPLVLTAHAEPLAKQAEPDAERTGLENQLLVVSQDLDSNRAIIRDTQQQLEAATTAIAESEGRVAALQPAVDRLITSRDQLQAAITAATSTISRLEAALDEMEQSRAKLDDEIEKNEASRLKPAETSRALAVALYIDSTTSLNQLMAELASGDYQIETHRDQELILAVSEASVGRVREIDESRAKLDAQLATLSSAIAADRTELRTANKIADDSSENLSSVLDELAVSTADLTAATNALEAAERQSRDASRAQTDASNAISLLEQRQIELTKQLAALPGEAAEGPRSTSGSSNAAATRPTIPANGKPALAVKVDNAGPARPQTGLGLAEVVFEEVVEGGITRYIAVFRSQDPPVVGPVRSARTSDLDILANLNRPLFANSGGNRGVLAALAQTDLVNVNASKAASSYFRSPNRRSPHNLYVRPEQIRASSAARSAGTMPELFTVRTADEALPRSAQVVRGVDIRFGNTRGTYEWDGELAGWRRSTDGTAVIDAADSSPIAPQNVIVQFTRYGRSAADVRSPEAISVGSGEAWFLSEGTLLKGRWSRATFESPTVYTDQTGAAVRLSPGRTWISLAPVDSARVLN